jgi:hypothetical protein
MAVLVTTPADVGVGAPAEDLGRVPVMAATRGDEASSDGKDLIVPEILAHSTSPDACRRLTRIRRDCLDPAFAE